MLFEKNQAIFGLILFLVYTCLTSSLQPVCHKEDSYGNVMKKWEESHFHSSDLHAQATADHYNIDKKIKNISYNQNELANKMINKSNMDIMYINAHITNEADYQIKDLLDETDKIAQIDINIGLEKYESIYAKYKSPRALFGIGKLTHSLYVDKLRLVDEASSECEDTANELRKDAHKFQKTAITSMCRILHLENVPTFLYLQAGRFCLDLANKMNLEQESFDALNILYEKYPHKHTYGSQYGLKLLLRLELDKCEEVLRDVIKRNAKLNSPKEKCLLGLCLKLKYRTKIIENKETLNKIDELVEMALELDEESLKLFNMIGTTYLRRKQNEEAEIVFDEGVRIGLFLSKWQRSSSKKDFRMKDLRGSPIWTAKQTGYEQALAKIQEHHRVIREEGLKALFGKDTNFKEEAENLREEGLWQQLVLFEVGIKSEKGCDLAPKTCALILEHMKEISAECTHGQVKFSVIHSGTHVWPHSGPSNCRLRAHLGLVIPNVSDNGRLEMRIATEYASWEEGKILIIDDSFEHELWYQGEEGGIRLILLIDMWHPDLTEVQKNGILPLKNRNQNHSTIFTVNGITNEISESKSLANKDGNLEW